MQQARQTQEEAQRLRQRQGVITDLQTTLAKFEQDLQVCIRNSLDSSINTHLPYMKKEDAYVALFSMLYTAKKETIANLIKEIMPDSAKQVASRITRQTEQDTFQRSVAPYLRTNKWTQRRRKSLEEFPDSMFNIPRVKKLPVLSAIKTTSKTTTKPPSPTKSKMTQSTSSTSSTSSTRPAFKIPPLKKP